MATEKQKAAARTAVLQAIQAGEMPPASQMTCEACGVGARKNASRSTIDYHHPDYSRPLYVIPLCTSCHQCVHFGTLAEPRTGRVYDSARRRERMRASKRLWWAQRAYDEALYTLHEANKHWHGRHSVSQKRFDEAVAYLHATGIAWLANSVGIDAALEQLADLAPWAKAA